MSSRPELEARAAAVGLDPANFPNDSVLKERIKFLEKNADTATGTAATNTVAHDGTNNSDGDTVTLAGVTYRFKTTPEAAYDVKIGASANATMDNLVAAINASGTPGTEYFAGTAQHPLISSSARSTATITLTARNKSYGNSLAATKSASHLTLGGANFSGGVPNKIAVPETAKRGMSGGVPS